MAWSLFIFAFWLKLVSSQNGTNSTYDPLQYVNPLIGTVNGGAYEIHLND